MHFFIILLVINAVTCFFSNEDEKHEKEIKGWYDSSS